MQKTEMHQLLASSHSPQTLYTYGRHLKYWHKWLEEQDVDSGSPGDHEVASYLTHLFNEGYSASQISIAVCAIAYEAKANRVVSPINSVSQQVMMGIRRNARGRGRGQSDALDFEGFERILETADKPRIWRRGRLETPGEALKRGLLDRAMVSLLFMAGMRRSEVSQLLWRDVHFVSNDKIYVRVVRSKTNQDGSIKDVRVLVGRAVQSVKDLQSFTEGTGATHVIPLSCQTINRRFKRCCEAAGLNGKYTSHSGRIGLASELSARGAPVTAIAHAGGWKSAAMVIHYSRKAELARGAVATFFNDAEPSKA